MIVFAYLSAFVLTFTIGVLVAGIINLIPMWLYAFLYKKQFGFWESFISGGIECLVLIFLSIWIFGWFNFQLPLLFIIIITLAFLSNNYYRIKTRPNYYSELGCLFGQLIGFPVIYYYFIREGMIQFQFI